MDPRRAHGGGTFPGAGDRLPILDDASIEAIARRVAEMLGDGDSFQRVDLLTAGEVARRLKVERSWVYTHANELGAIRMGGGTRPRLRFELQTAAAALASLQAQPEPSARRHRGRPRKTALPPGVEPLRGRKERG